MLERERKRRRSSSPPPLDVYELPYRKPSFSEFYIASPSRCLNSPEKSKLLKEPGSKYQDFPDKTCLVRLYFFHDFYAFHPLISYTGIPISYRLSILPINNKWFACREGLSLVEMKPHPSKMLSPSHFLGVISGV